MYMQYKNNGITTHQIARSSYLPKLWAQIDEKTDKMKKMVAAPLNLT